jgi:hypothetical protein
VASAMEDCFADDRKLVAVRVGTEGMPVNSAPVGCILV